MTLHQWVMLTSRFRAHAHSSRLVIVTLGTHRFQQRVSSLMISWWDRSESAGCVTVVDTWAAYTLVVCCLCVDVLWYGHDFRMYWPFVWHIHCEPMDSQHKGTGMRIFWWKSCWIKRRFETPSRSCGVTICKIECSLFNVVQTTN